MGAQQPHQPHQPQNPQLQPKTQLPHQPPTPQINSIQNLTDLLNGKNSNLLNPQNPLLNMNLTENLPQRGALVKTEASTSHNHTHHCVICNDSFSDVIELQYHLIQKHIGQPILFERCSICGARVAMECLNNHIKTCHPNYYNLMTQIHQLQQANATSNLTPQQLTLQNQLIQQQLSQQIATLNQPAAQPSAAVEAIQAALNMARVGGTGKSGQENGGFAAGQNGQMTNLSRKRKSVNSETVGKTALETALSLVQQSQQQQTQTPTRPNPPNQSNHPHSPATKKGRYHCPCGTTFEQENSFNAHKKHYCDISSCNNGPEQLSLNLPNLLVAAAGAGGNVNAGNGDISGLSQVIYNLSEQLSRPNSTPLDPTRSTTDSPALPKAHICDACGRGWNDYNTFKSHQAMYCYKGKARQAQNQSQVTKAKSPKSSSNQSPKSESHLEIASNPEDEMKESRNSERNGERHSEQQREQEQKISQNDTKSQNQSQNNTNDPNTTDFHPIMEMINHRLQTLEPNQQQNMMDLLRSCVNNTSANIAGPPNATQPNNCNQDNLSNTSDNNVSNASNNTSGQVSCNHHVKLEGGEEMGGEEEVVE